MFKSKEDFLNFFILFFLACIQIITGEDDFDFERISTLTIEHSFDSGPVQSFCKRGTITIRSLKSGVAHISQDAPLDELQQQKFKRLIETDGTYNVRIPTKSGSLIPYVEASIKACALYEGRLKDVITLNVDQSGNVFGVGLTTPVSYCAGLPADDNIISSSRFTSNVDVIQTALGPVPETQTYIQKMEQEKAEKAKGQQADNRSFFAKYWMYLVPLFIFLMFASNADPNAGGGGR